MARHQESSSINVFQVVKQLIKDTKALIYKIILIQKEVHMFYKANIAFSKCYKARRTFNIRDALGLIE